MFVSHAEKGKNSRLTLRQREVLQLLAEGKSMKEAADVLSITPRTIAFHRYSMMEQLGFKTGAELIQHAVTLGLVSGGTPPRRRPSVQDLQPRNAACQFCQWFRWRRRHILTYIKMATGQLPNPVSLGAGEVTAATNHVRLLLVDDNSAVLRQVIQLLPREFEVVATLEDSAGLRQAVLDCQPDIIVLNITLPPVNGVALATQLRKAGCTAGVVLLTVHSDPDYARAAFAAGGIAYVVKTRLSLDIAPALRAALRGESVSSRRARS